MKEREISPFFMPFSSPIKFYSLLQSVITICLFNQLIQSAFRLAYSIGFFD